LRLIMLRGRFPPFQLWHNWLTAKPIYDPFATATETRLAMLVHGPTTYSVNKTRKTTKPRFGRCMFHKRNASLILERGAVRRVQISVNLQSFMVNSTLYFVIPTQAGNQLWAANIFESWIPAYAEMTDIKGNKQLLENRTRKNKS
jgi:hypothetical protein